MGCDERDVFKHNSFCYFVLKANARETFMPGIDLPYPYNTIRTQIAV